MKGNIHWERNCYILMQGNWIHPHAPIMRVEMIWYPERAMTAFEQYLYRPYVQSVVTENPWVISLYDRERVWIVDEDGAWRNPPYQTYGGDFSHVVSHIMNFPSHVAGMPLDGGRAMKKVIREYAARIKKANKLYA